MIKEMPPNSYLAEWSRAHDCVRTTAPADVLEGLLRKHTISEQERFWDGDLATGVYDIERGLERKAWKEAIDYIFTKFLDGANGGVEFGCGAKASLFKMLPLAIKPNWIMADVSGFTLTLAKRHQNEGEYIRGSFHNFPIKKESQEIVAGFNSFDTTMHVRRLMKEVQTSLKEGGYLLAMQDVIPNPSATLLVEFLRNGRKDVTFCQDKDVAEGDFNPVIIQTKAGEQDVRSYHQGALKEAGEKLGMRSIFYGIIESNTVDRWNAEHALRIRLLKKFILDDERELEEEFGKNSFWDLVSKPGSAQSDDVKIGFVKELVAVNVLVMRK